MENFTLRDSLTGCILKFRFDIIIYSTISDLPRDWRCSGVRSQMLTLISRSPIILKSNKYFGNSTAQSQMQLDHHIYIEGNFV